VAEVSPRKLPKSFQETFQSIPETLSFEPEKLDLIHSIVEEFLVSQMWDVCVVSFGILDGIFQ
jgi:hypothetical protein